MLLLVSSWLQNRDIDKQNMVSVNYWLRVYINIYNRCVSLSLSLLHLSLSHTHMAHILHTPVASSPPQHSMQNSHTSPHHLRCATPTVPHTPHTSSYMRVTFLPAFPDPLLDALPGPWIHCPYIYNIFTPLVPLNICIILP